MHSGKRKLVYSPQTKTDRQSIFEIQQCCSHRVSVVWVLPSQLSWSALSLPPSGSPGRPTAGISHCPEVGTADRQANAVCLAAVLAEGHLKLKGQLLFKIQISLS